MNNFELSLKGLRIAVTGAAGHLGSAICRGILDRGGAVYLLDRNREALDALTGELQAEFPNSPRVETMEVDLEGLSEAEANELFSAVEVAGLVNNAAFVGTAGLTGWGVPFEAQTADTWRRALDVNLTAPFILSQAFVKSYKSKSGSIVNIDSIYGHIGPDWSLYAGTGMGNPAAYAASKGGLVQFSRWLASTVGPDIRVNSVAPGGIERGQDEKFQKRYCAKVPMERLACENDIVGAVLFLLSPLSAYITGQAIMVDGGYSIV